MEPNKRLNAFLEKLAFFGAIILVFGLLYSNFMQSVGCGLIFLGLFNSGSRPVNRLRTDPLSLCLIAYYTLYLLSGFYIHNHANYLRDIELKLPFVLLPLGFAGITFSKKRKEVIIAIFIGAVLVAGLTTLGNYLVNFESINNSILHSKPIPIITTIDPHGLSAYHIYYSIFLAFAALISLIWVVEKKFSGNISIAISIISVVLIILLHTISARTGLAAFYAGTVFFLVYHLVRSGKWAAAISVLTGILLIGVVAVMTVPSLKNRMSNTITDIQKIRNGENLNDYSIAMRLEAIKVSARVYKMSPIIGVGKADLDSAVQLQYIKENSALTPGNRKLPHNQFVETAVSLGLIGLAALLALFVIPMFQKGLRQNQAFIVFMVVCFTAFQFESALERQAGITFFTFFYLLLSRPTSETSSST